jgi:PrcB C-terminal
MNANRLMPGLSTLLLGAVLAVACRSSATHASEQDSGPFRTLLYGYQSALKPGTIRVAHNASEWSELWAEHTAAMMPRPEPPAVDWKKEMVVCIALGERPTAGYGVEIAHVERQGNRLIVEAREKKPAPDAIVPQVVTHPYVMAVTPRSDGEVELRMN